jgi:dTDP-4-dehydrorhamnose reductase
LSSIIIFGASGQLGRSLSLLFPEASSYNHSKTLQGVDITDTRRLEEIYVSENPKIIINATAFTNVDACEVKKEKAFAVNSSGVRNLAILCTKYSAKLIHFSTDYVFNGKESLYQEDSTPDPINYYGFSKSVGDAYALALESSLVIRTSGVFGYGKNFPRFVYDRLSQSQSVDVIYGFYSPITADLLSRSVKYLIDHKIETTGILNIAGDRVSRYDLANAIARTFDLNSSLIRSITTLSELKAHRPYDSSLDISKAKRMINFDFHSQRANMESFERMLATSQN